jgi:hypothetical protein
MKLALASGTTSQIVHVFIQDSTVTTGAGKTGLVFGDITAYYVRAGGVLTALTMETIATLGTWASTGNNKLGFKLLHDTNAPGLYELDLPDNILATGASSFVIQLRATGAAPCLLEVQIAPVGADMTHIHGTALTEAGGSGRLAAAISTFGDVATPVFTATCVNQGGDAHADAHEALTRLPDASPGGVGGLPTVDSSNYVAGVLALGTQAKLDVNAEVDTALNTAIPGSPTADSVNERIATMDGHVTADYGSTEKAAIDLLDDAAGGLADIHTDLGTAITAIGDVHATDLPAVKTVVDAILVDTGTTLEADLDAILADTNELQTDWADGGRLDLLLDGASSAGDPWLTALPGAYGAGTAGKIIGDNINAPVATVDTVVDGIATNVAAVLADTGTDGVVVATASKTGFKLASDGLDSVAITAPTGVASNFREMMVQLWRRFFKKTTVTATDELKTFADDGTTTVTTQTVSDTGGTQTQGAAT